MSIGQSQSKNQSPSKSKRIKKPFETKSLMALRRSSNNFYEEDIDDKEKEEGRKKIFNDNN